MPERATSRFAAGGSQDAAGGRAEEHESCTGGQPADFALERCRPALHFLDEHYDRRRSLVHAEQSSYPRARNTLTNGRELHVFSEQNPAADLDAVAETPDWEELPVGEQCG